MRDYKDKTKEELIEIIHELEERLENSSANEDMNLEVPVGCFREQYSREILDTFPDMITVFDYDTNCIEVVSAPQTNHVEGFSNDQLCSMKLEDMVPEEPSRIVRANMEEVIRTGQTHTAQHSLMSNGELHYYENRVCPLDGRYLLCVCRDITKRVNAEHENQKQQKEIMRLNSLMEAILENIPVYLFVKDVKDNFRYLYWNKETAIRTGIPAEKALGRVDYEIFSNTEDVENFRKNDLETMKFKTHHFEEDYITRDGIKRMMHTTKLAVNSPNGDSYLIGISWDITDAKETEKKLIAACEQAKEADQLKSAFLANMSHEIRTPLNAIVGFSRLVVEPGHEEEKEEYSRIIEKNSDLLLNLFNDIVDLSSLEAGSLKLFKEEFSLYAVCQKEYANFHRKVSQGVRLIMDEMDMTLCMTNDKARFMQVLTHLLGNAIKFTSSGEIHFGYQQRGDVVQFYVKDSGIGIAANRIATIFQRFGKIDNFAQGTGLGLAVCRLLVERLGGRIWARSVEGAGTIFYFTLPLNV